MKLREIIAAYKCLGEAKVTKIEESEVLKIVKARKKMRPFVEEYDAFLKDCQEKFKPENFDELQNKIQRWSDLSDNEKREVNLQVHEYEKKVTDAIREEFGKDIRVSFDKLEESTLSKILVENCWELKKIDELEVLM